MGIVDDDVQRVRDTANLRDVVAQYVQLRRVGRQWAGLCPFHTEKTGSFYVNEDKGLWRCHGCQKGGDVITFVREIEHLDFAGSIEWLAGKVGLSLRYTEAGEDDTRKRRRRLVDVMTRAVEWYHQRLLSGADAGQARGYLRSRGFDKDTVTTYQIGWAPDGWDQLAKALRVGDDVWTETGLGYINRQGRQNDSFRARVLFPIFDVNGDPVAFGGRIMPGGEGPKYKNSSETPIYSKSRVLYALNWHKSAIVTFGESGEAVVCEGYTDVIGFARAGVPRAVATCGTALTEDHLRMLRKFSRRVVLAFDADAAGQNAAARFYEWENKLDLEVLVAALPRGVDPGELAQTDPEALARSVAEAVPFLGFRVSRTLDAANLATPEGRARAADAALAVVAEHPQELVRDQYVMEIAGRTRFDVDQLRRRLAARPAVDSRGPALAGVSGSGGWGGRDGYRPQGGPGDVDLRPVRPAQQGRAGPPRAAGGPEVEALKLLIHEPESADQYLMVDVEGSEELFADPWNLAAFRALAGTPGLHEAIASAEEPVADLLVRLATEQCDADPEDVMARLVEGAALRELPLLQAEASSGDSDSYARVAADNAFVVLTVQDLRDSGRRNAAVGQLLAWLASRSQGRRG